MTVHQNRCEVWLTRLSDLRPHERELAAVLTPGERADSGGHADTTTSTLSRAVLRLVLAQHLSVHPERLKIDRSCPECGRPHGRPRLSADRNAQVPPPHVSVSHGGDLLVVALAPQGRVGVDVEPHRPGVAVTEDLLELALTAAEQRRLASAPPDQRHRLFLHHWTGKEAVLKALWTGLDVSLLQAVTLPAPPARSITKVTVPGSGPVRLAVQYLDVGPGHVCALATEDLLGVVQVRRLAPSALLGSLHP